MRRFDRGFEKWLRQKSVQELERVVNQVMRDHQFEQDTKAYVECVRSMEHEWLDKVHEWLRENFETQLQAMENHAETEKMHEEAQDTQSEDSLEE